MVLYQVWAFVAPGLYSHEKKMVLPLVISSTLLFFIGVAFCYFIVIPSLTKFIVAVAPSSINTAPDIEQYFGTVLTLFLVFGIAFEVPIAVVVLARIGVVTHRAAEEVPRLLRRGGVHRVGHRDAARRGVAALAGDTDVPALRDRHLVGQALHPRTKAPPEEARGRAEGRLRPLLRRRAAAPPAAGRP